MEEKITQEMFNGFVQVAELQLTDAEAESILKKMNDQLTVVSELESIPVDKNLPPTIHGNPFPMEDRCPLREDVWTPFPNSAEIIAAAPHSKDGYIVAPDVPHQKIG